MTDDAGHQWTYQYDLLGRATVVSDPDSGVTTSTFNDAGDVVTIADANNAADPTHNPVTFFDYDASGRKVGEYLTSKTGTKLATWTYDTLQKGQLTSSSRFDGTNEYKTAVIGYNSLYKPAGTTVTLPATEGSLASTTYTISNTYNVDGTINSTSIPATGDLLSETLNYVYDATTGLATSLKTNYGGTTKNIVLDTQYTSYGEQAVTTFADSSHLTVGPAGADLRHVNAAADRSDHDPLGGPAHLGRRASVVGCGREHDQVRRYTVRWYERHAVLLL